MLACVCECVRESAFLFIYFYFLFIFFSHICPLCPDPVYLLFRIKHFSLRFISVCYYTYTHIFFSECLPHFAGRTEIRVFFCSLRDANVYIGKINSIVTRVFYG